jgi:hypothetical protein
MSGACSTHGAYDEDVKGREYLFRYLAHTALGGAAIEECGAAGGMKIGRGTRSNRRIPTSVLLCPPQTPMP